MFRKLSAWLQIVFMLLIAGVKVSAAVLPEGFAEVQVANGLNPTTMALTPDGRLLLAQKDGRILLVTDGQLLAQPIVTLAVDAFNERGLSGLAVDPNFATNGYLYVFYTVPNVNHNRLIRLTIAGDFVVPGSEFTLLEIEPMAGSIHNGGAMHFGPDGYLYITTGDGANPNVSQSLTELGGKVLRIASDGSIPTDNPFYNQTTGNYRAIWALGFRNPYTFSIEPGTGRIHLNDVGSGYFEEVNAIVKGGNYGWPLIEGVRTNQAAPANYQDPIHAYPHTVGCAVVGSTFYQPATPSFPAKYMGKYFFGDYCSGFIKVLNPQTGAIEETFLTGANRPLQLLTAPNGDLYYLSRAGIGGGSVGDNTSTNDGALWRVFYQGVGAPVVSVQPRDITVSVGREAIFTVRASGTPPFTYQWNKDSVDLPGETNDSLVIASALLADSGSVFSCLISNASGQALSNGARLLVTSDRRPDPFIEYPGDGFTWRAGDTIRFGGYAIDPEEGLLDVNSLTWKVDLYHNDHSHPVLSSLTGTATGSLVIPRFGEVDDNIWLRLYLTATDSNGLSNTIWNEYFPEKRTLTLLSQPSGLELILDGKHVITPYSQPVVVGIAHEIEALKGQTKGDSVFSFLRYTDGSTALVQPIFVGENDTTLTALYESSSFADGTGLLGIYYQDVGDQVYDFREKPTLFRVDPGVDFNWGQAPPAAELQADFFAVQWLGEVTPFFSEWITFKVETDDGTRLWIDNNLIIDQWVLQGTTETQGNYYLEKGKKYPILLEYFENQGDAVAVMRWQGEKTPYQVIPARQLFPADRFGIPTDPFAYEVKVMGNPVGEKIRIQITLNQLERVRLRLFDVQGRTLWTTSVSLDSAIENLEFDATGLGRGLYFLEIEGNQRLERQVIKVVK